jgi:hypothetical protein
VGCRPLSLIGDLVHVARKTLGEFAEVCAYRKSNPDIPIVQSAPREAKALLRFLMLRGRQRTGRYRFVGLLHFSLFAAPPLVPWEIAVCGQRSFGQRLAAATQTGFEAR